MTTDTVRDIGALASVNALPFERLAQSLLLIMIAAASALGEDNAVEKPVQMAISPRAIAPFEAVRIELSILALPDSAGWLYDGTVDPIEYLAKCIWIRPPNSDRFTNVVVEGNLLYSKIANGLEPQQWPTFDLTLYEGISYSIPLAMVVKEGSVNEIAPVFSQSGEYEIELRIPIKGMTRGASNPATKRPDANIRLRSTVVVDGSYPRALAADRAIQQEMLIPFGSVHFRFEMLAAMAKDESHPQHAKYASLARARRRLNGAYPYIADALTPIEFGDRSTVKRHVTRLVESLSRQHSVDDEKFHRLLSWSTFSGHRFTSDRAALCSKFISTDEKERETVFEAIVDELHVSHDEQLEAAQLLKPLQSSDFAFAPEAAAMTLMCLPDEEARRKAAARLAQDHGNARVWVQFMRYRINTYREWRDFRVSILPEESRDEMFTSPSRVIIKGAFQNESHSGRLESYK